MERCLRAISEAECAAAGEPPLDRGTISAIAASCHGDIRSAIHSLQFHHSSGPAAAAAPAGGHRRRGEYNGRPIPTDKAHAPPQLTKHTPRPDRFEQATAQGQLRAAAVGADLRTALELTLPPPTRPPPLPRLTVPPPPLPCTSACIDCARTATHNTQHSPGVLHGARLLLGWPRPSQPGRACWWRHPSLAASNNGRPASINKWRGRFQPDGHAARHVPCARQGALQQARRIDRGSGAAGAGGPFFCSTDKTAPL
jgi:hypothetical protein